MAGGAGQILNSRSEFNWCHMPRLVVEEEDKEARTTREAKEKQEKDEMTRALEGEGG